MRISDSVIKRIVRAARLESALYEEVEADTSATKQVLLVIVMVSVVGGVPEIMSDGAGYVVPPNRPDLLAEKLSVLVNNKEMRTRMGLRAIEVANAKYNIDEMVEKFRTLYTELAR